MTVHLAPADLMRLKETLENAGRRGRVLDEAQAQARYRTALQAAFDAGDLMSRQQVGDAKRAAIQNASRRVADESELRVLSVKLMRMSRQAYLDGRDNDGSCLLRAASCLDGLRAMGRS